MDWILTPGRGQWHLGDPPRSALDLVLYFDSSVSGAPASFIPAVQAVQELFKRLITTPVTIIITVGYGEVLNGTWAGGLGQSTYFVADYTYSQIRNALIAGAQSADAIQAVSTLGASDPTGGGTIRIQQPLAKGIGLIANGGSSQASPDGSVGFATGASDYSPAGSPGFAGTVAHEIAEVLGRSLLCGVASKYNILDLFRYSAAATRNLGAASTAGYFSIDNGTTNLQNFNTGGGDPGDWSGSGGADAFNAGGSWASGQPVTATDQKIFEAIGWNTTGPITWPL